MVDLGTLGGSESTPYVINDAGQVVGIADRAEGQARAFSWTVETGMTDLGTRGADYSYAVEVDESGQLVGSYRPNGNGTDRAFVSTENGGLLDLNTVVTLPDQTLTNARRIADDGSIIVRSNAGWSLLTETGAEENFVVARIAAANDDVEERSSGNAMVFSVSGNGTRTADAFDGNAEAAAQLHVTYR